MVHPTEEDSKAQVLLGNDSSRPWLGAIIPMARRELCALLTRPTIECVGRMTAEIKLVRQRAQMLSAKLAPWLRQHGPGVAWALVFGALGLFYSITTPLFETPDEPFHYRYVQWIVQHRALPPLVVSQGEG